MSDLVTLAWKDLHLILLLLIISLYIFTAGHEPLLDVSVGFYAAPSVLTLSPP